ncbi:hypothetical protein Rhopal_007841-T1 [Rhodotorula paludigena]|uniref:Protein BIG1 n=1 Tax=Rhodotorula paludigena TaxID=86838 RepID=A0AAV5GW31_9BASI|nr:hypothetical protein Rhopal_007841-T1 [Rhodotorula paludigena]
MLCAGMLLLAALSATALALPYPLARVPLLAYSTPRPFLGLDDGFSDPAIGTVAFIPAFHACGTLLILSVDDLAFDDFALLPRSGLEGGQANVTGAWDRYNAAPTNVMEPDAVEGHVLAWARGWRKTCGRGAENREVRVVKVDVDGVSGEDRAEWAKSLDSHIQPFLAALPPAPHNSVIMLTSLSPSTLRTLFDLASPPPTSPPLNNPPPTSGRDKNLPPDWRSGRSRPRRSLVGALVHALVTLVVWAAFLTGAVYAGKWAWAKGKEWKERRAAEGGVRLPLVGDEDELDLGAESSEDERD